MAWPVMQLQPVMSGAWFVARQYLWGYSCFLDQETNYQNNHRHCLANFPK